MRGAKGSPSKGSPSRPSPSKRSEVDAVEDGGVRVLLRDARPAAPQDAMLVAPEVLRALSLSAGDVAACTWGGSTHPTTVWLRVWPDADIPAAAAELSPLLVAQLGAPLGERAVLRVPEAPVVRCDRMQLEGVVDEVAHLAWTWRERPVWVGAVVLTSRGGRTCPLRVVQCEPSPSVVDASTVVALHHGATAARASQPLTAPIAMDALVERVLRCLDWCTGVAEDSPRALLLFGPAGSGKSLLMHWCVAQRPNLNVSALSDVELGANAVFRAASLRPPAVVVVDNVERLGRGDVAALVAAMQAAPRVRVLAACSGSLEALATPLRGLFEVTVEVGALDADGRVALLQALVGRDAVSAQLQLPGMVAGDVVAVAREARMLALLRNADRVGTEDVQAAVRRVHQHSAREWEVSVPHVSLDAIGGMQHVKQRLLELLDWPLRFGEAMKRLGVRPSTGVLMYGPPGNGKTMMARAVATRCQAAFIAIKGPELYSKYVGESERALEAVFVQARRSVPCVVFLDEIDALAPRRDQGSGGQVGDRVLSTLLSQLDGVSPLTGVTVLAATNRPDQLDPALLRPGRLSHHLYVPLPDCEARASILASLLRGVPCADDVGADFVNELAARCEGLSGAECNALVREAKLRALEREGAPCVTRADLDWGFSECPPRTQPEVLEFYEAWRPPTQ